MENIRNRYLMVTAVLLLLCCIVNRLDYDIFEKNDIGIKAIKKIPYKIKKWTGKDVYLSENIYKILETKSIVHRNYVSESSNIFLSLVYYPDTKVDFHAPEACLGGSGERLLKESKTLTFEDKNYNLDVNQIVRRIENYEELIFYWYKAGAYMGKSYLGLRFNIAKNKITNRDTSGALIRVSTAINNKNYEKASEELKQFIEGITPILKENI